MADDPNPPDPSLEKGGEGAGNQKGIHVVLKDVIGKEYADEKTALDAIKETFSYVGDVGGLVKEVMTEKGLNRTQAVDFIKTKLSQEPAKIDESRFVSRDEFSQATFFADNPQYRDYKDIVQTFKKANPSLSLDEVVKLPSFKQWHDSALEASKKQKSILHTNPKIQVAEDKLTEAKEGMKKGNTEEAKSKAVSAVLEAFEMRG